MYIPDIVIVFEVHILYFGNLPNVPINWVENICGYNDK